MADMEDYRARKAGIALKIEKKMEERYDEEDALGTPERVRVWMNTVLKGEHAPCEKSEWRCLQYWLRDGVAMCRLVNKLLESQGMETVKFKPYAETAFVALANIETFNKACQQYGLPEINCFNSIDLYEGHKGPFVNVINTLNYLGYEANRKSFIPEYEGIAPPTRDAERWNST